MSLAAETLREQIKDGEVDVDRLIYHYAAAMPVPQWVDIDECTSCSHCQISLKSGKKHICRLDGLAYCSQCTTKLHLPDQYELKGKNGPTRVCYGCRMSCLRLRQAAEGLELDAIKRDIHVPEWQEKESYIGCNKCAKKARSPHNCRCCGMLYCDDCSSKMSLDFPPAFNKKNKSGAQRVCDGCRYRLMAGAVLTEALPVAPTTLHGCSADALYVPDDEDCGIVVSTLMTTGATRDRTVSASYLDNAVNPYALSLAHPNAQAQMQMQIPTPSSSMAAATPSHNGQHAHAHAHAHARTASGMSLGHFHGHARAATPSGSSTHAYAHAHAHGQGQVPTHTRTASGTTFSTTSHGSNGSNGSGDLYHYRPRDPFASTGDGVVAGIRDLSLHTATAPITTPTASATATASASTPAAGGVGGVADTTPRYLSADGRGTGTGTGTGAGAGMGAGTGVARKSASLSRHSPNSSFSAVSTPHPDIDTHFVYPVGKDGTLPTTFTTAGANVSTGAVSSGVAARVQAYQQLARTQMGDAAYTAILQHNAAYIPNTPSSNGQSNGYGYTVAPQHDNNSNVVSVSSSAEEAGKSGLIRGGHKVMLDARGVTLRRTDKPENSEPGNSGIPEIESHSEIHVENHVLPSQIRRTVVDTYVPVPTAAAATAATATAAGTGTGTHASVNTVKRVDIRVVNKTHEKTASVGLHGVMLKSDDNLSPRANNLSRHAENSSPRVDNRPHGSAVTTLTPQRTHARTPATAAGTDAGVGMGVGVGMGMVGGASMYHSRTVQHSMPAKVHATMALNGIPAHGNTHGNNTCGGVAAHGKTVGGVIGGYGAIDNAHGMLVKRGAVAHTVNGTGSVDVGKGASAVTQDGNCEYTDENASYSNGQAY